MRYVYIALIVLLTAVVLLFNFQNLTSVTISLLGMSVTLPVSVLVILVYVLGMVTGGALFSLVRSWIRGARQQPKALIGTAESFAAGSLTPPEARDRHAFIEDSTKNVLFIMKNGQIFENLLHRWQALLRRKPQASGVTCGYQNHPRITH